MDSKNFSREKIIRAGKAISVFLAITMAILVVYWGFAYLQRNADISIDGHKITKSDFEYLSRSADEYKKDNPSSSVTEQYLKDALIMNRALKQYISNRCGSVDLAEYSEEVKKSFGGLDADTRSFEFLQRENELYKKSFKSCIIKNRNVFSVIISYETPYMSSGTKDEVNEKYDRAREILNSKFMPLFREGRDSKYIASMSDVNLIEDEYASGFDFSRLNQEIVSMSKVTNYDYVEGVSGDNVIRSLAPGNTESSVWANGEINKLKVGEYTNVLMSTSGVFSISRVESVNDAEFYTWEEFLNKYKSDYKIEDSFLSIGNRGKEAFAAKTLNGNVCYAVAGNTWTCQATGGSLISKPGFFMNDTYPDGDFRHLKAVRFRIVDQNGVPVNGVKVDSDAPHVTTRDTTSYVSWNGLNYAPWGWHRWGAFSGDGYAFGMGDCNVSGTLTTTMTAPEGYVFSDGKRTMVVTNPIAGSNHDGVTDRLYTVKKEVVPPVDIPDSPSYTSNAKTFIKNDQTQTSWIKDKSIIAPVGSTVSYRHTIEANFASKYSKFYLNWSRVNREMPSRQHNKTNVALSLGSNSRGNVVDDQSSFKVLNSDLGRTVCERVSYGWNMDYFYNKGISENTYQITAKPSENIVKNGLGSAPACFYVPYHYELTPCMVYDKGVCGGVDIPGEPGGSIPVTPSVSNTSGGTNSRNDTKWIVTSWNIPGSNEGVKTKSGVIDNNISDPCSVYRGLYGVNLNNCSIIKNGEQSFEAAKITNLAVRQITIPENAEIGSRYCIGISVSPYRLEKGESQSSQNQKVGSQWRHSAPICVLATKKPKLQVWGNGIYSRGGIRTSLSNYGGKGVFGSWVEFEAMSEGLIDGFRSEASHTTNNLTFTNRVSNKGKWGQWSGRTDRDSIINNIRSRYPASRDGVVVQNINGTYGGVNGNSPTNRNVNTRIINSNSMYITGNIISRAVSRPNNLKAFQQTIIIVDGDLYINKDVTQIDAWLIVRGKIVTCAVSAKERSDIVNNSNCGKNLIINGPVISGSLKSWRTGNSDYNSPDIASEVYNQRADVYLWAYAQGSESGKVTTTYTKELPVRY